MKDDTKANGHPYDCSCVDCYLELRTALTEAKEALEQQDGAIVQLAFDLALTFDKDYNKKIAPLIRKHIGPASKQERAALAKIREVMP